MVVGNHIVNNFTKLLNKEIKNRKSNKILEFKDWGVNPIEFYKELRSDSKEGKKAMEGWAENNMNELKNYIENISEDDKADIGYTVITMIVALSTYIERINVREGEKTYINLVFTKEFYDEVFTQSVNSIFLPMICKPILWKKGIVGGYISEVMRSYAFPDQSIVKSHYKLIS